MMLTINIPEEDIPKRQEIKIIEVHFIDGQVCGCTYPYEVNELDKIRSEIQHEADNNADAVEMKAFYRCLQILDKYR